jgi:RHS repeat-associated protein
LEVNGGTNGTHFYMMDGNGNVAGLVNASDSTLSAQYAYGPFGELLRASGAMAFINTFGFASQYTDYVTRRLLYLNRPYNPSTGSWDRRDPIGEEGHMSLYGFVGNNPINSVDLLGMQSWMSPGYGALPNPVFTPQPPDPIITGANAQFDDAYNAYRYGTNSAGLHREYGPSEPWTKAFQSEYKDHLDKARLLARKAACAVCAGNKSLLNTSQPFDYNLNNLSVLDNVEIFIGDMARYSGALENAMKRLGSFRLTWTLTSVDCPHCTAQLKFDANDSLNRHSNFRIPLTNIGPKNNPKGTVNAPYNTVYVHWFWDEKLDLNTK